LERRLGFTSRERMLREMATLVAALPAPLVLILEDLSLERSCRRSTSSRRSRSAATPRACC
jgi:hypothetical protein